MVRNRKKLTPKKNRNRRGREVLSNCELNMEGDRELNMEAEDKEASKQDGVVPDVPVRPRQFSWENDIPDSFVCR